MKRKHFTQAYFFLPFLLLLILPVFVLTVQQPQEQRMRAQVSNCAVADTDYAVDTEEQAFIVLLNNYRQQNGLSAVKLSPTISRAAAWLAHDMATKNYMSHTDSLGRSPSVRMTDCGYNGRSRAENVAQNNGTAQRTFEQWRTSPGHNANMLSSSTVIGLARGMNGRNGYWALALGGTDDSSLSPNPTTGPTSLPTAVPTGNITITITPLITQVPTLITPTLYCLGCGITPDPQQEVTPVITNSTVESNPGKTDGNGGGFFRQLVQLFFEFLQKLTGR